MSEAASEVVAYWIVAGLSVLAFLTTTVILSTARDAANGIVKLALGVLLLLAAWHERPGSDAREGGGGKAKAFIAKLEGIDLKAALATGLLFVALPKRLAITVLTGITIAGAGLSTGQKLALVAIYVLLASVAIWLTLLIYFVGRERRSRAWAVANAHAVAFVLSLAFGLLFTGQAIAALAG